MPSTPDESSSTTSARRRTASVALEKLGLHRPELRAWAMYDWANSAMVTTIITAVFPDLLRRASPARACSSRKRPPAGMRIVDRDRHGHHRPALARAGNHRRLEGRQEEDARRLPGAGRRFGGRDVLHLPAAIGSWPRSCSSWPTSGPTAASSSTTPCCRTLPAKTRSTGSRRPAMRWATSAAARCWRSTWRGSRNRTGSGCLRDKPDAGAGDAPARLAFLSVAVWWLVFSIPLFRRVPEPRCQPAIAGRGGLPDPGRHSTSSIETGRGLRRHRQAFLMLLAFLIYNDGIGTIIRMAIDLRQRDRDRPGRSMIAVDHDRAVRRHPVRVPLRDAGRSDRRQAIDRARAGRSTWQSASSAIS